MCVEYALCVHLWDNKHFDITVDNEIARPADITLILDFVHVQPSLFLFLIPCSLKIWCVWCLKVVPRGCPKKRTHHPASWHLREMRFKTYHESDLSEMAACRIMILNVRFFGTLWIPSYGWDMYQLLAVPLLISLLSFRITSRRCWTSGSPSTMKSGQKSLYWKETGDKQSQKNNNQMIKMNTG